MTKVSATTANCSTGTYVASRGSIRPGYVHDPNAYLRVGAGISAHMRHAGCAITRRTGMNADGVGYTGLISSRLRPVVRGPSGTSTETAATNATTTTANIAVAP